MHKLVVVVFVVVVLVLSCFDFLFCPILLNISFKYRVFSVIIKKSVAVCRFTDWSVDVKNKDREQSFFFVLFLFLFFFFLIVPISVIILSNLTNGKVVLNMAVK